MDYIQEDVCIVCSIAPQASGHLRTSLFRDNQPNCKVVNKYRKSPTTDDPSSNPPCVTGFFLILHMDFLEYHRSQPTMAYNNRMNQQMYSSQQQQQQTRGRKKEDDSDALMRLVRVTVPSQHNPR